MEQLQVRLSAPLNGQFQQLHLDAQVSPSSGKKRLKMVCEHLQINPQQLICRRGFLRIADKHQAVSLNFHAVYNLGDGSTTLELSVPDAAHGKEIIRLKWWPLQTKFQLMVNTLSLQQVQQWLGFLSPDGFRISALAGNLNLTAEGRMADTQLQDLRLSLDLQQLSVQAEIPQGELLTESLNLKTNILVKEDSKGYQIHFSLPEIRGNLFAEPYYVEFRGEESMHLQANVDMGLEYLTIDTLSLQLANLLSLRGSQIDYDYQNKKLKAYQIQLTVADLKQIQLYYLDNLLAGTEYEGLEVEGKLKLLLNNSRQYFDFNSHLESVNLVFKDLLKVEQLSGRIFWQHDNSKAVASLEQSVRFSPLSEISWNRLWYQQLPIGATRMKFKAQEQKFWAIGDIVIPVFDGKLLLRHLSIENIFEDLRLSFDATLEPVELQLITRHFGLPPMQGKISALIPGTRFSAGSLQFGGKLWINVFDGSIAFDKVSIEEPLSEYSRFFAQVDLHRLSLEPLTKTFGFGKIQGRVSGYIRDLHLLNWQPQSFDFYLASIEDDDLEHLISQKAVDNLSDIGGFSGFLSRGFMRFFENFSYDKLGIGCRLKQGECLMRGVENQTGSEAYYLVKGGGLPRIDILGFEKRVDWNTLISRIQGVAAANAQ